MSNKFEVLICGKYYRVASVSKLVTLSKEAHLTHYPINEKLAIEWKQSDGLYIVVNFLTYNKDKKRVELEDVGCRTVDTLDKIEYDRLEEYHNCLSFAKQALIDMNEKGE